MTYWCLLPAAISAPIVHDWSCCWRRRHLPAMLLLLTVVATLLTGRATSEELYTPFTTFCPAEGGSFSHGSTFEANRYHLFLELTVGAATNARGFLNTSFGDPGSDDEVFGVAMCFADVSLADCKKCLDRAPSFLMSTGCPSGRTGALVYNECLLGYSDHLASLLTDGEETYIYVTAYVDDMESMNYTRWNMMRRLIAKAAASSSRYALDNNETYTDPMTGTGVYGLVQCRRDLTPDDCTNCLSGLVRMLLTNCPNNTAAYLKGFSCFAKYHPEPINLTVPEPPPPPDGDPPPPRDLPCTKQPKAKMHLIVGLSVAAAASAIFFLLTLAILLCLVFGWWKKRIFIASAEGGDVEATFGAGPKGFSYDVLATATSNFSDEHKLGEGGFGCVYRGFLEQLNMYVAIKRFKSNSEAKKEYASEVTVISQLRHRNLVRLIGWCHSHDDLLLVYDLMPNGSLDRHLYSADNILSWQHRYDIILGIGSALLYLHQDYEQGVLHRDIKPSNVMLDSAFNAKLGDFGLARLVDHGRGAHTTELAAGTLGYMDPECMITRRFSTESDMYSFGVVLLEVACGRRPVVIVQDESESTVVHLARRVLEMHGRGEVLEAADPRLDGNFDERQMERVLVVGLWCTQQDQSLRPSIWQAIRALRFEASLPTITNGHEPRPVIGQLASVPSSSILSEEDDMATSSMHASLLGPDPPTNYYTT